MITNNANVTQPVELSEEEAKREIDIYLEKIQQSFDRFDETHERIFATQVETRAILDDIHARIARL